MPNPVQGSTTVRINADKETSWMLRIEDVLGKTVGGVRASGVARWQYDEGHTHRCWRSTIRKIRGSAGVDVEP
ncbi:MAG: hypothetical protein IPI24_02810 [Ignavibacteria bacterium]|nr:hypothetical protein [Ignavibacteria bacterium]